MTSIDLPGEPLPDPRLEPPLALPLPEDAVLLDDPALDGPASALALAALRQHLQDLGLEPALTLLASPEPTHTLLGIEGFRLQLICVPFWAEVVPLATAPWRQRSSAPQLVLAACVEPEARVVRLVGVLTNAELLALALPAAQDNLALPLEQFRGGLERLLTLVKLLRPEALPPLLLPRPAPANTTLVSVMDWLAGQLDQALTALGAELMPNPAAAFRSRASPIRPEESGAVQAVVRIPLGLVNGTIRWGDGRAEAIERFQLQLTLCGPKGRVHELVIRLEPQLQGDLLPDGLRLVVKPLAAQTKASDDGLEVRMACGSEPIAIQLERHGQMELNLPPLLFNGCEPAA
jgi:hypothetical protein